MGKAPKNVLKGANFGRLLAVQGTKYAMGKLYLGSVLLATAAWGQMSPSQAASAHPVFSSVSGTVASAEIGPPDDPAFTIKKQVDEVHLLFTATDKHGHFVKTLEQSDLTILDDHKVPEAVLTFRRETDLPLQVGLLVDVSGSVRSRFVFEHIENPISPII